MPALFTTRDRAELVDALGDELLRALARADVGAVRPRRGRPPRGSRRRPSAPRRRRRRSRRRPRPAAASWRQWPRPMPRPPPVTTPAFPSSAPIPSSSLRRSLAGIRSECAAWKPRTFGPVRYEKAPPLARIVLNDPQRRNPQSPEMVHGVQRALADARRDHTIRVVIVKAAGESLLLGPSTQHRCVSRIPGELRAQGELVRGTVGAVPVAHARVLGVPQAHDRGGAGPRRSRWNLLGAAHRHDARVGGRDLPDAERALGAAG